MQSHLDDIDEDDVPSKPVATTTTASKTQPPVMGTVCALDDFFGGLSISPAATGKPVPTGKPVSAATSITTTSAKHDPLDDIFGASPSKNTASGKTTEAPAPFMDFQKPVVPQVQRHLGPNADLMVLEELERQRRGEGSQRHVTLGQLKSTSPSVLANPALLKLMSHYDILGVQPYADSDDISRAYKKKALALHPDKVGRPQTEEEESYFKAIVKAYEVLSDAEQRTAYDAELAYKKRQQGGGTGGEWIFHMAGAAGNKPPSAPTPSTAHPTSTSVSHASVTPAGNKRPPGQVDNLFQAPSPDKTLNDLNDFFS